MPDTFKTYLKRNLKAVIARFGDIALLDEVAESNLASALATKINGKADAATTLAGYGITNAYTKTETDAAISAQIDTVYKPAGNKAFSELTSSLLVKANLGNVYNLTTGGTTTSDFVSGAGNAVPTGADVSIVDVGTVSEPSYKFNVLAGFIDLTSYLQKSGLSIGTASGAGNVVTALSYDPSTGVITPTLGVMAASLTDLSASASGDGNVVTGVSYNNSTGAFTITKGSTAILSGDLVDLTSSDIDDIFTPETSGS